MNPGSGRGLYLSGTTHHRLAPMLHIGDTAPNLTLALVDGRPIPLSEFWRGGPAALLVFLRHLG